MLDGGSIEVTPGAWNVMFLNIQYGETTHGIGLPGHNSGSRWELRDMYANNGSRVALVPLYRNP